MRRKVRECLNVEVIECKIADSSLIGILATGNDNGLLLPRIVKDEEVEYLRGLGLKVEILHTSFTALGNVILSNNRAALTHPEMSVRDAEFIRKFLNVSEVVRREVSKFVTVGSIAVVNDVGGLIHPDVSDDVIQEVSRVLGIQLDIGTVNFGIAFVKTGLVANNYGALVGERTTGPEIMRVVKALGLGGR